MFPYRLPGCILAMICFGCTEYSKFRPCRSAEHCVFDTVDFINQIGAELLLEFQMVDTCYLENAFYYDRAGILSNMVDELLNKDSLVTLQIISKLKSEIGMVDYNKYPWSFSVRQPSTSRREQFDLIREGKNIGLVVLGYPHQIDKGRWLICVSYMRGNHGFTMINYYEQEHCQYKRLWSIDSGIIY
jgi:hypothetical protein